MAKELEIAFSTSWWKPIMIIDSDTDPSQLTCLVSVCELLGCVCLCVTHGTLQARILKWVAFPLSQGIFATEGSNLGHLHCRQILLWGRSQWSDWIHRFNSSMLSFTATHWEFKKFFIFHSNVLKIIHKKQPNLFDMLLKISYTSVTLYALAWKLILAIIPIT